MSPVKPHAFTLRLTQRKTERVTLISTKTDPPLSLAHRRAPGPAYSVTPDKRQPDVVWPSLEPSCAQPGAQLRPAPQQASIPPTSPDPEQQPGSSSLCGIPPEASPPPPASTWGPGRLHTTQKHHTSGHQQCQAGVSGFHRHNRAREGYRGVKGDPWRLPPPGAMQPQPGSAITAAAPRL